MNYFYYEAQHGLLSPIMELLSNNCLVCYEWRFVLDFYRKYNENSPQVRYYQQTLLQPATHQPQQPLGEMVLVIEQIISLQRLGLSTHMYLDKLFNFTKYGKGYVGNN